MTYDIRKHGFSDDDIRSAKPDDMNPGILKIVTKGMENFDWLDLDIFDAIAIAKHFDLLGDKESSDE